MTGQVFEYVLTKQDFLRAQRLYRKTNRRAAFAYWLWVWVVPVLGCLAVLCAIWAYEHGQTAMLHNLAPFAGGGLWFALFLPLCRYYSIQKLWKQSVETTEGKPVRLQFDEEQLISSIPGKSEGRFLWNAILKFEEDEQVGMLFVRKKNFLCVPKAALPGSAWEQLRLYTARK